MYVRRLNRDKGKREALCRNLLSTLVLNGEIHTTTARAKEVRSRAERLIHTGQARRSACPQTSALAPFPIKRLFTTSSMSLDRAMPTDRAGYTRALRLGTRRGDGAQVMMVQLVD